MRRARALATAVVLLAAGAVAADARVINAETVLPPGQSGHVSIPGVASGTGSPHLNDQTCLFTSFRYKSALFNQAGPATTPKAGVRIVRGPYGVPAVTGASDYDAWWGVGYAVAQDRLFQLELFRRATSGRLAEILGDSYLDDDLIARRDYYTDAELDRMIAAIPATLRRRAEAYRDGINAWAAEARTDPRSCPGEFAALAVAVPTWTLRDTARVGIFLARTVPSGDGREIENARALKEMGAAGSRAAAAAHQGRVSTVPSVRGQFSSQPGRTRKQERAAYRRSQRFVAGLSCPARRPRWPPRPRESRRLLPRGGSYMWGIGRPAEEASCQAPQGGGACSQRYRRPRGAGNAFLFNGPQLGFSIPELFVEFELHSPGQNIRGVSAAGVPVLGIGHNGRVAWGFTSGCPTRTTSTPSRSPAGDLPLQGPDAADGVPQRALRLPRARHRPARPRRPPPAVSNGSRTERICRTVHGPVQVRAGGVAYARRYAIWGRELETIVA